jgi:septal ring factor EnvC (AmiA/AmiB activator)
MTPPPRGDDTTSQAITTGSVRTWLPLLLSLVVTASGFGAAFQTARATADRLDMRIQQQADEVEKQALAMRDINARLESQRDRVNSDALAAERRLAAIEGQLANISQQLAGLRSDLAQQSLQSHRP